MAIRLWRDLPWPGARKYVESSQTLRTWHGLGRPQLYPPNDTSNITLHLPPLDDPHYWLEDVLGSKALARTQELNAKCLDAVGDPKDTHTYQRIKEALDSKDRIPSIQRIGTSALYYNFWKDKEHVQGIWRRTTLESFLSEHEGGQTKWSTVMDLDALSPPTTGTAKSWVWGGSTPLDEGPKISKWDRALIKLSPGGSDASTFREFDLATSSFVDPNGPDRGFVLPKPAKTSLSFRSREECLVGTDFGEDGSSLTSSGYPRIIKSWKRGTPIEEAVTVFEVNQTDISASQYAYHDRGHAHEFQLRAITFYTSAYLYRSLSASKMYSTTADAESQLFKSVPIPEDAELSTFADVALVTLSSDLSAPPGAPANTVFPKGALVSLPMTDLINNDWSKAMALFTPTPFRSLSSPTQTKDYLVLKVLEDVRTGLEFWRFDADERSWTKEEQELKEGGKAVPVGQNVGVSSPSRDSSADNRLWLWRAGYLVPPTLELASAEDGCTKTKVARSQAAMFNTSGMMVEQRFAVSADGTRVPYFVIRKEDMEMNGTNPTLIEAYGGFQISKLPGYSAAVGAGWLERGGTKVVANIRGGAEYGPSWHQAAVKEKKHKSYEDMEAVAQALIHAGLTTPSRLACIGGSNGGLMVGNLITRPIASRLFGAAVCQVPLLDMKRYSHLLAGASWMGEYGDPDKPEDWKFSPYQVLRHDILGRPEVREDGRLGEETVSTDSTWRLPKTLFTTSTRDDRVHPGHLRKMVAALLEEAGPERAPTVLAWENTEGGHGGAANNDQRAFLGALVYNFLSQSLGMEEKE